MYERKKKVPERWSQNWRGRGQDPKRRLWQQRRREAQATQSCRLWVCSNPTAPTGNLRTSPTTPFCNEPQQPARLKATRELDAEAEERSKRKGFWEQEKWDNFGLVNLVRLEGGRIQSKQRIRKQIDTWLVVRWRGQRCNVSIKSKCGIFSSCVHQFSLFLKLKLFAIEQLMINIRRGLIWSVCVWRFYGRPQNKTCGRQRNL